jgi:hypothetical protein
MPSRQHSSAMLSSPRNPSRTIRIFSSALFCLRVLHLMSRMIFSDDDCRPVGLCFISNPQLRMNKNSLLNQIYICPIGADGVQAVCVGLGQINPPNKHRDPSQRAFVPTQGQFERSYQDRHILASSRAFVGPDRRQPPILADRLLVLVCR